MLNPQTSSSAPALTHEPRQADERVWDNALWASSQRGILTIAIPTFRDDAVPMIEALATCERFGDVEIVLFDDGGGDEALVQAFVAAGDTTSCAMRVVSAAHNAGRSVARNRLISHARSNWLLLLDADMLPDAPDFLTQYISRIEADAEPGLIVGGFSLKQAPQTREFALHRWQAARSECLSAAERNVDPGRFAYTSNVLAHRDVLTKISFDENFSGWGWEDVDWGLRIAQIAPVIHLDNPATHMGLDTAANLMAKYGKSGPNFAYALSKHPTHLEPTPLGRHSRRLAQWPNAIRAPLKALSGAIARNEALPAAMRGNGLKLWRALIYAEALS
ncbi:MAG: family 2 glycosyl transferase [Hirschia sp.]|nr:family 2 glycosyl transferase [Hirschia sp.]MBF18377.1 family 2 glycosyl transferase [Hirschia sp.]